MHISNYRYCHTKVRQQANDASAGNIDWKIRWGYTADEQLIAVSEAAPTSANVQKSYKFDLDVSDMIARKSAGFGDILWVTIERTTGDGHGGAVAMINIVAYYTKWCEGEHF